MYSLAQWVLAELWHGHHSGPRDYVVHAASPTHKQTIPDRHDFGQPPPFYSKGDADSPHHRNSSLPVTTSSLFLKLAKTSRLCLPHTLSHHTPLASRTSYLIHLPFHMPLAKIPIDGHRSLSTVTEGHKPEGNAQGSPSAQLQAQTVLTIRQSDDIDDTNLASALTATL